jgi:ADP-heptose:LPS heptosyltransferase
MIGIHAVAANRNSDERMWNIGHWAELLRLLIAGGHDIKFIGAWEDRPYYSRLFYLLSEEEQTHIFDMVGIKTLECIPWEIWKCSVLVCVNSAIMHIAVEFSPFTPVVAIVGGTPARIVRIRIILESSKTQNSLGGMNTQNTGRGCQGSTR